MAAWFPCYPNDLLGSMRWKMMKPAQRGAYWQLICWQMQSDDGHLPADLRQLSALADLQLQEGDALESAFPVQENGRRANLRALRERQRMSEHRQRLSEAGSQGVREREARKHARHKPPMKPTMKPPIKPGLCIPITTTTTNTTATTKENTGRQAPPSLAEWLDYAGSIGYDKADAEGAWNHYEANGWRQKGGNKIKSWPAACRTCKKFAADKGAPQHSPIDFALKLMRGEK